jgi:hypothetical protein
MEEIAKTAQTRVVLDWGRIQRPPSSDGRLTCEIYVRATSSCLTIPSFESWDWWDGTSTAPPMIVQTDKGKAW